ncbi:MAG: hypothetical protein PHX24_03660 [Acidithiobacillus sp.]|nr:hypothetical protein [Acidithiobacillus sp.]
MTAPKRIRFLLYEEIPQHREILCWLDNYSGRARQTILANALQIGLRQLLGESMQKENPSPSQSATFSHPPVQTPLPEARPSNPKLDASVSQEAQPLVPDFVKAQPKVPEPSSDDYMEGREPGMSDEDWALKQKIRRELNNVMGDN